MKVETIRPFLASMIALFEMLPACAVAIGKWRPFKLPANVVSLSLGIPIGCFAWPIIDTRVLVEQQPPVKAEEAQCAVV